MLWALKWALYLSNLLNVLLQEVQILRHSSLCLTMSAKMVNSISHHGRGHLTAFFLTPCNNLTWRLRFPVSLQTYNKHTMLRGAFKIKKRRKLGKVPKWRWPTRPLPDLGLFWTWELFEMEWPPPPKKIKFGNVVNVKTLEHFETEWPPKTSEPI